jgi:hypothetical protein
VIREFPFIARLGVIPRENTQTFEVRDPQRHDDERTNPLKSCNTSTTKNVIYKTCSLLLSSQYRSNLFNMSSSETQPLLPETQPQPTRSPQEVSKRQEIRIKLRTYEIILAVANGHFPTTKQFTDHLHWLLRSGILEPRNRRLSVRGRNAIRDLRAWIDAIAEEAEYKNGNDEIQQFIWELSQSDIDVGTNPLGDVLT